MQWYLIAIFRFRLSKCLLLYFVIRSSNSTFPRKFDLDNFSNSTLQLEVGGSPLPTQFNSLGPDNPTFRCSMYHIHISSILHILLCLGKHLDGKALKGISPYPLLDRKVITVFAIPQGSSPGTAGASALCPGPGK
jgi:hypothetical protein